MRDRVWDAMATESERIADNWFAAIFERGGEFDLVVHRRRSVRNWTATDGFYLAGYGVEDGAPVRFEPVRERRLFSRHWHEKQPVASAAERIGAQLQAWAAELEAEHNGA